ncbi:MAG: hypothetical protein IJS74_01485 [Clostridia bacterium]|nr:hypothetical protein [Clostridia bacterium]
MDYVKLEKFLKNKIPNADVDVIGKSVLGRNIYAVYFDFHSNYNVIIQASIHAREHITTSLVVKFIKDVSKNFEFYKQLNMPNIIFVPMANPDGVMISCHGLKSVKNEKVKFKLQKINIKNEDFTLFKANANAVDLNNNFDANWGTGKENVKLPAFHGYIGKRPESEPEVKALVSLTKKVKPCFTISYHCKGEEIYYDFYQSGRERKRDKKIAKLFAKATGYKIKSTEKSSSGGYKDWCVQKLKIPSITVEVGSDNLSHPISEKFLPEIYQKNKNVIKLLPKAMKIFQTYK